MADSRRGLTLGKYAPLHRGHQLVIETALAEMDEIVVVVYDAPEATDIPLRVRADWIRELYPCVEVLEAWDGPAEVGYAPATMRAHERYLLGRLGQRRITHFYSSERYGEHVSRALGAVDRRVDVARVAVPVSATAVRANPFAHRAFLHPRVYRDLVVRVALLGAPATGKTTLAERLAAEYATEWMPEYGREYWERHQVGRRLTPAQLLEIAREHIRREDELLPGANRYLFVDTNALTTATFARYYHGSVAPELEGLAAACASRYDVTLVCDGDIPYDDTWDRSGEVNRAVFQRQVVDDLRRVRVPFVLLRGDVETRVAAVRRLLARFRKFANPLSLAAGAEG
ncbi:MAG: AAA family ATPase [Thermoanaerobaculia bacterium]|nr:AAA family ATPase [Thermoanaerobaculia bacterium]